MDESLFETVRKENHLKSMLALRDALADQMDKCRSPRDYAPLALRLQEVLTEIKTLQQADTNSEFNNMVNGFSW